MNLLLLLALIAVILAYLEQWFWFIVVIILIVFIVVGNILRKSVEVGKKVTKKVAEVGKKEAEEMEKTQAEMPAIEEVGKEAIEGFKGVYLGKETEKPASPLLEAPIGYTKEVSYEEKHPLLFAPWKNTIKTAGTIADRFIKMLQKLFKL